MNELIVSTQFLYGVFLKLDLISNKKYLSTFH